MKPLVSIIIPVYQAEHYIDDCIHSVLNQNYPNIEIILINDGSTDNSLKKCDFYNNKFDNIILKSQKNNGASSARNLGILSSHGKYIFFMDSDDMLATNCISNCVNAVERGYQFVFFDYFKNETSKENKNKTKINKEELNRVEGAKRILNVQIKENEINGYLWNKFFLSSIIKNNNIKFDIAFKMWEDLLFCIKYLQFVDKIVYIHEKMYFYNETNNFSISRSVSTEVAYSWIKAGQSVGKIVFENFPDQYDYFNGNLSNIYMTYVIIAIKQNEIIKEKEEIFCFLESNKKKLRKKYKFFWKCIRINFNIGRFIIRILS